MIGYLLDERDDIAAFHSLIEEHLREGDLVISPASKTDLQHPAVRDQACGAPAEQCVAVAEDDIWGRTGEAVRKVVDLPLQRLEAIDPDYARHLEETPHRAEATRTWRDSSTIRMQPRSYRISRPPRTARRWTNSARNQQGHEEADSIGIQGNAARGALPHGSGS